MALQAYGRTLPGPAGKFADMKSKGASVEAIQAVIGTSLANRAHGEDYSRVHAPAWETGTGFDSPSWLAALECLDVEEFDESNEMFEHCVHHTLSKSATHKVSKLLLIVVSLKLRPSGEATAVMQDPTGQLKAAVHRGVLEAEPNFGPGATVSLKDVSLLCPWPGMEYLCVTPPNILQVFPAKRAQLARQAQLTSTEQEPVLSQDPSSDPHPQQTHQQQPLGGPLPIGTLKGLTRPLLPAAAPSQPLMLQSANTNSHRQTSHSGGGSISLGSSRGVPAMPSLDTLNIPGLQEASHQGKPQMLLLPPGAVADMDTCEGAADPQQVGGLEEDQGEQGEEEEEEEEDNVPSLHQFNVLGLGPPRQQHQQSQQPPQSQHHQQLEQAAKRQRLDQPPHQHPPQQHSFPLLLAAANADSVAMPPPAPRRPSSEVQAAAQHHQGLLQPQQGNVLHGAPAPPMSGPFSSLLQGKGFASMHQAGQLQQQREQLRMSQLMPDDDDEDIEL